MSDKELKAIDTSSTDAMHWAECLESRLKSGIAPDADFIVGWFANYWGACISAYERKFESAEAREAELRNDVLMLNMTCNSLQKLVAKEQEESAELRARLNCADDTGIARDLNSLHQELEDHGYPVCAAIVARAADCIEKLRARVAELEAQVPKWVPVSERLPESTTVLCIDKNANIHLAWHQPNRVGKPYQWDCDTYDADHVTHWMPLPAAPKEEV